MQLKTILAVSAIALGGSAAYAATTMTAAPSESWTVSNYYKQAVYDPKESKIGDVDDVLIDKSGKVTGLVIGVGGFLGAGEKDVIVPFSAVKTTKKNDKWWLTLNETKVTSRTRLASNTTRPARPGCLKRSNAKSPGGDRGFFIAKMPVGPRETRPAG